jgi:DNA modification methylase
MAKAVFLTGDALTVLKTLPDESVQCCVTSPPYWGLRDYGVEGQLGLEESPEAYVANMVAVFREVRRVLRRDGTLWLNIGDSYYTQPAGNKTWGKGVGSNRHYQEEHIHPVGKRNFGEGLKPKDLVGIPWMLAFALRADGWWLRSDIIWAKPNPMPESVTDRPTKSHEQVFLLTKAARYYWDAIAVAEQSQPSTRERGRYGWHGESIIDADGKERRAQPDPCEKMGDRWCASTRNLRSVWTIATQPFKGAHFATMSQKLAETCIKAGTSERGCCPKCGSPWERVIERFVVGYSVSPRSSGNRDRNDADAGRTKRSTRTLGWRPTCSCGETDTRPCVVLDPFGGAGTTALVALRLNRDAILIELNPAYTEMARDRCAEVQPVMMTV